MTTAEAKFFLGEPYRIKQAIAKHMRKLVQLADSSRPQGKRVQEQKAKIIELTALYTGKCAERAELIVKIPHAMQREVLLKRYVECQTWSSIADMLHYDKRWIYRVHGRALQSFIKITPHI